MSITSGRVIGKGVTFFHAAKYMLLTGLFLGLGAGDTMLFSGINSVGKLPFTSL